MWRETFISKDYLVSDSGEVMRVGGNVLTPIKTPCGYYKVGIKGKQVDIHLLVVRAYPEICGEWYKGCQVNHLDEDKSNNNAHNLQVTSPKQNCLWGTRSERKTKAGSGIPRRIYQYDEEGELVGWYDSQALAARFLGINQTNISRCMKGIYKTAGGYKWSYDLVA